jgi:alpha/beta superfamily hydrolase
MAATPEEIAVRIENRLEGRLSLPADKTDLWCAIVTHPHPKLGGRLDNNVTQAICKGLQTLGVATIRFNTRGVGESGGECTWQGVEEREDVKAVVDYAHTLKGVTKVALVAYSFGAAVGLSVSAELVQAKKLDAVIAVAYPKGVLSWFLFNPHYAQVDAGPGVPKLFVIGDTDNFTSISTIKEIVQSVSEPKELVIVDDTDHYCFGKEVNLVEPVVSFFHFKLMGNTAALASSST